MVWGRWRGEWWSYEEAGRSGVAVEEIDLMREILRYNEGDCRVLLELVRFLKGV
jgi:hypothetical protein